MSEELLRRTAELAIEYVESLDERRVGPTADRERLMASLGGPLSDAGVAPATVIEDLAREAAPGLMAMSGPRFFGFVIGGTLPAALAADWLTSTWDQNAAIHAATPAAAVVDGIAAEWVLELLDLPRESGVGFVTGCQVAHFVCLAAARHAVLSTEGWDVEAEGLNGAPPINVLVSEEAHVTVPAALRMLGIGLNAQRPVAADAQGRMEVESLRQVLAGCNGPTIVCAQTGNVNTGSFDPLDEIADTVAERPGTWLHVDGAFGLWAAASPALRHLVRGIGRADSWATDAHKWLNVPYDSGIAIVRDAAAHRAAMGPVHAAYIPHSDGPERDPWEFVPEYSRRGRAFPVYAALRSLGRIGVTDLVERTCRLARRMADRMAGTDGVEILNEVVLNQVLVRFTPRDGGDTDAFTREVIRRVQDDGTCWLGGTTWHGMAAMRVSVINWSTTEDDIDRSADAILRCAAAPL